MRYGRFEGRARSYAMGRAFSTTAARRHGASGASLVPRIEGVAQGVADQVEGDDGNEHREAGEERDPPRAPDLCGAVLDDVSPARMRGTNTDAKVAERGLEHDHVADAEGRGDDHRREGVGEDVPPEHAPVARAHRPRGEGEVLP